MLTLAAASLFAWQAARTSLSKPPSAVERGHRAAMAFMVRITTQTSDDEVVFMVEGCLAGPAVREFETCWRDAIRGLGGRRVRVDLTAACHVDAAGRELLSLIHRAGALFVTKGCVMPEVIREISGARTCCPG